MTDTSPSFNFVELPREHGISIAVLRAAGRLTVRVALDRQEHLAIAEAPLQQCRLEQARAGSVLTLPEPAALIVGTARFDLRLSEAARVAEILGAHA